MKIRARCLRWYAEKGYGFCRGLDEPRGAATIFVHCSVVEDGGPLEAGEVVDLTYIPSAPTDEKGPRATLVLRVHQGDDDPSPRRAA